MYKEFYGLREYPFNMTPDRHFFPESASSRRFGRAAVRHPRTQRFYRDHGRGWRGEDDAVPRASSIRSTRKPRRR